MKRAHDQGKTYKDFLSAPLASPNRIVKLLFSNHFQSANPRFIYLIHLIIANFYTIILKCDFLEKMFSTVKMFSLFLLLAGLLSLTKTKHFC